MSAESLLFKPKATV